MKTINYSRWRIREIAAGHYTQCLETMMTGNIEWLKAKIAFVKIGEP
jgi:hypothetical protein